MKKVYNAFSNKYINVLIDGNNYITEDGKPLFRIETKGRTGKTMYRNFFYISGGRELRVHGMDGATGHGWGGRICGYLTQEQLEKHKEIR